jgi:DNA repair ATPase RecN
LTERLGNLQFTSNEWETSGRKRLKEVEKIIEGARYAIEEHKQLAKLDRELAKLGYDAAAHDELREQESELREIEEDFSNLKSAKEVSKQINGEIKNLEKRSRTARQRLHLWKRLRNRTIEFAESRSTDAEP